VNLFTSYSALLLLSTGVITAVAVAVAVAVLVKLPFVT